MLGMTEADQHAVVADVRLAGSGTAVTIQADADHELRRGLPTAGAERSVLRYLDDALVIAEASQRGLRGAPRLPAKAAVGGSLAHAGTLMLSAFR